jgi:hypothetical protein
VPESFYRFRCCSSRERPAAIRATIAAQQAWLECVTRQSSTRKTIELSLDISILVHELGWRRGRQQAVAAEVSQLHVAAHAWRWIRTVHGTPQLPTCRCGVQTTHTKTTGFRKVVKATILVRKKPGMSDEAFIEHYNHVHAQMAAPVLQKHNVITYSLVGYLCYPAVDVQRGCRLSDCFVCVCRHIASSEIERS